LRAVLALGMLSGRVTTATGTIGLLVTRELSASAAAESTPNRDMHISGRVLTFDTLLGSRHDPGRASGGSQQRSSQ